MTLGHVHTFCPLRRLESPRISYSYQGEDFFNPKRLKRAAVIPVRETYQKSLLAILTGFFFVKSLTASEQSHRFQPGKLLQTFEYVSYSIRYCRISLLIYSGSRSLSSSEHFLTHSVCINCYYSIRYLKYLTGKNMQPIYKISIPSSF